APLRPENLGRRVDLADIVQAPRPQLKPGEASPVRAQRHLVVDARGHVAEVRRRDVLAGDRLEIEYVDGLGGGGDESWVGYRYRRRGLRTEGLERAIRREEWAPGQKLQE